MFKTTKLALTGTLIKIIPQTQRQKDSHFLKTSDSGQWTIALLKISTDEQNETELKIHLITTTTVTIPSHHISLVPLKAIKQAINTKFSSEALLEIETVEQSELVLMPTLERLGSEVPGTYMAVLWNPSGQNLILKWNMTICYVRESDYKEKGPQEQLENSGKTIKTQPPDTSTVTIGEVIKISHDKLPPCQKKNQHLCSTTIYI